MTNNSSEQYLCQQEYHLGLSDHVCFSISSKFIDEPVEEFVLMQCAYPEFRDDIVEQLRSGYDEAKERAESNRRQYRMLEREIDTLKENLAHTRNETQVGVILEMIEEKMREQSLLSEVEACPAGTVGQAINIEEIEEFLMNPRKVWDSQPTSVKNMFLQIVLDRVVIYHQDNEIRTKIIWSTGLEQEIIIHRPETTFRRDKMWTSEEDAILRDKYEHEPWGEVIRSLPNRTYLGIPRHAREIGLKRQAPVTRKHWTTEELELLQQVVDGNLTPEEFIIKTDRSPHGVDRKLKELEPDVVNRSRDSGSATWEMVADNICDNPLVPPSGS